MGEPVRVRGLAAALWMELGLFLTQAGLGGGVRVRTVPVAPAVGDPRWWGWEIALLGGTKGSDSSPVAGAHAGG